MCMRSVVAMGIVAWVFASTAPVIAEDWLQKAKLKAGDREPGDGFGASVAVSGDTALIGAGGDDDQGSNSGSVVVFEKRGGAWAEAAKLIPTDVKEGDHFGEAVALDGDTALIGARGDDDLFEGTGSAYVFERADGVWKQTARLTASDGLAGDSFGTSVALDQGTAVVGARYDDEHARNSGSAYVFEKVNGIWKQTAKLIADDGEQYDWFGNAVAVSGDTVFVGAFGDDNQQTGDGSVYVFRKRNGAWTHSAKLTGNPGTYYDDFGSAVALHGNTALIGASEDCGAAYIFNRIDGAWTPLQILTATDCEWEDFFGVSVALADGVALIGATGDSEFHRFAGAAYVFETVHGVWTQTAKLVAPDGRERAAFGLGVALSGETALIGAGGDGDRRIRSGSAYIFDAAPSPDCSGEEGIAFVECRSRHGVNRVTVALEGGGGSPPDTYTVTLSSGESKWGALGRDGKAKARFMEVPPGAGTATVSWGCGAVDSADYSCDDSWLWQEDARITPGSGQRDDRFGHSVAASDGVVLVGAPDDDSSPRQDKAKGAAYFFESVGGAWMRTRLTANHRENYARFGSSVALFGDTAFIGARNASVNGVRAGSAYVLERINGAWIEATQLAANDGTDGDYFGVSAALSGDTAVFGADHEDDLGRESGSAYVFERIDGAWVQVAKLLAEDGAAEDQFGWSVAVSGDAIIVGAPYDEDYGFATGSAHVFEKVAGAWVQTAKLLAADATSGDRFGQSVAMHGNAALVGAWGNNSAYLFEKVDGIWAQTTTLKPHGGQPARFGYSVALTGDTAAVTAMNECGAPLPSAVYVYEKIGGVWGQTAKRTASSRDGFGAAVALSGDTIVVGALCFVGQWFSSSAAYIFDRGAPPACTGEEHIASIHCKPHEGGNEVTVFLEGGQVAPHDTYTVTLSSGEQKSGTLSSDGTARVRIQSVAPGEGTATVAWGCGATPEEEYVCR